MTLICGQTDSKLSTLRCRFQFTNRRQEVLNSCAYNQTRPTPILRSDCDERASHSFSGDVKYSPAADTLELRGTGPLSFNSYLLMVKVEQYVICL
jgi:hypothetical protein